MPTTYAITAPNGKTLEITGDRAPTEAELTDIFAKAGVDTKAAAPAPIGPHPEARMSATPGFRPAPDGERVDSNLMTIGGVGIPPEAVLMGPLQAGRALLDPALSLGGKAAAGVSAIVANAAPIVKYELAKHILRSTGLPEGVSTILAATVSGFKKGGLAKAATTAAEAAVPAEAAAVESAAAPSAAPAAAPAAAPTPVTPAAVAPGPRAISPQQRLNEDAIAARRAAVAARDPLPFTPKPAAAEPVVAASGKMQLTAPEMKQFTRLVKQGMKLPDALDAVRAMRDLASRLGGASDAEVSAAIAARR